MSHEIEGEAANRVYGLLLADCGDEIEEDDIKLIERQARRATVERLASQLLRKGVADKSNREQIAAILEEEAAR